MPRKKYIPPPPDLTIIKDIIEYLSKNKMDKYSILVHSNGTAQLIYGSSKSSAKRLDLLFESIKRMFKE
jgi:hypothetical protein